MVSKYHQLHFYAQFSTVPYSQIGYGLFKVLDWPGNSPDLNPIENIWSLVKKEMAKECITNRTQLINRLTYVWNHHPGVAENIKKCIGSMPRRVQAVISAKGGTTKY